MHAVQNDFFWTLTSRPYPLLAFPFLSRSFNASSRCRLLHLCQINKINPGFKPQPLPKLLSRRKRLLPALIYLVIIWCGQCRQNSPLTRFFICCCCFFYINHWFNVSFKKNCLFVSQILFGKSARTTPHVVQQIKVKFASNLQCRENASKPATITDKVICAGNSTGNRNACKGDRCSPIVVSKILHMRQFAKL